MNELDFGDLKGYAQPKASLAEALRNGVRVFLLEGRGNPTGPNEMDSPQAYFARRVPSVLREKGVTPFRAVPFTISSGAMINEVDRARGGVLYLDEPEWFHRFALGQLSERLLTLRESHVSDPEDIPVVIIRCTGVEGPPLRWYRDLFTSKGIAVQVILFNEGAKTLTQDSAYLRRLIAGEVDEWKSPVLELAHQLVSLSSSWDGQHAWPAIQACIEDFQKEYL